MLRHFCKTTIWKNALRKPPILMRGMSGNSATKLQVDLGSCLRIGFPENPFPGHALHEKGIRRQKDVSPMVSSQERRAAVVPWIDRLSTALQPAVNRPLCSSIWFTWDFGWSGFRGDVQDSCLRCPGSLGGQTRRRSPGQAVPSASCLAPPRNPAVRRPAPTCLWYIRVLDSTGGSL